MHNIDFHEFYERSILIVLVVIMILIKNILVIGAGVNGLWTGIELLKRGHFVTILDQFGLNNDRGSSHGQSRITRYLYDEPTYPAFMPESDRKWKQLQKDYKTNLYKRLEFEYS